MADGLFYNFITYLEEINKQLIKYQDQVVVFQIEKRGMYLVDNVNRDYGEKSVWFGVKKAEDGIMSFTLSELIQRAKVFQEECFDSIPVLAEFKKSEIDENSLIRFDIPITELSVGLSFDEKFYIFIVKNPFDKV